jgi:hypothetical protein
MDNLDIRVSDEKLARFIHEAGLTVRVSAPEPWGRVTLAERDRIFEAAVKLRKQLSECGKCNNEGWICLGCGMPISKCTAVSTGCIRNEGRAQQKAKCECQA